MTRESGPVAPLEQRCIRPGYWLIEGYEARHRKGSQAEKWGTGEWQVFDEWLSANPEAKPVTILRTLPEVRGWIREQR